MNIIIKVKNLDLTDELKIFTEKKIGALKKFIDVLRESDKSTIPGTSKKGKTLAEAFVELEKETEHHKKGKIYLVKVRINLPGKNLIAQARSDSPLRAVTSAKDELEIEIKKYKFKGIDRNRRKGRVGKI